MRQTILRLVCDDCGRIGHFELTNSNPLTATMDVGDVVERAGWGTVPKDGAGQWDTYDCCPTCARRRLTRIGA
jgi:hypothetical protein